MTTTTAATSTTSTTTSSAAQTAAAANSAASQQIAGNFNEFLSLLILEVLLRRGIRIVFLLA